jgi:hypothetical protein
MASVADVENENVDDMPMASRSRIVANVNAGPNVGLIHYSVIVQNLEFVRIVASERSISPSRAGCGRIVSRVVVDVPKNTAGRKPDENWQRCEPGRSCCATDATNDRGK